MKKGFTLVELLAVIVILGILVGISYPVVNNTIKASKQKAYHQNVKLIEEAAKKYLIKYEQSLKNKITLDELKQEKLIEGEFINPINKEKMSGCIIYKWNVDYNQYDLEYKDICPNNQPNLIDNIVKRYDEEKDSGLIRDENNKNRFYYKGTNKEVNNNYLWYGGHLWRILEINIETQELLLITEEALTIIQQTPKAWTNIQTYENVYTNKWLNEYFYNSLSNEISNNLIESKFNIIITDNTINLDATKKIGLLDELQYKKAGGKDSYLDTKKNWWLGNSDQLGNIKRVNRTGDLVNERITNFTTAGVRPVIKISELMISEGDGTINSMYKIKNENSLLEQINVGDYLNIPYNGTNICGVDNKCSFRVVSKDGDSLKIVLNGFLPVKQAWSDLNSSEKIEENFSIYSALKTFSSGIKDYLYVEIDQNNPKKFFGRGDYTYNDDYDTVQNDKLFTTIGLPVVGEMFSSNDFRLFLQNKNVIENNNNTNFWTMNRYDLYGVINVSNYGMLSDSSSSNLLNVRPVIYIKNNLSISSGDGSPDSPYELK